MRTNTQHINSLILFRSTHPSAYPEIKLRNLFGAVAAFSFILSANAQTPFKGSSIIVPPLMSKNTHNYPPLRVMRMPAQAGVVESVVATRFPHSDNIALITKGSQYYSLCTPNQARVACAPITNTDSMRDIDVSAYVDSNDVSLLAFNISKETQRTPAELAFAIAHFKIRFAKVGQHFDSLSTTYKPKTPKNRNGARDYPHARKAKPMTIDAGDGSCTFNDAGTYDCTGGDSGGSEGGYNIDTWDWSGDGDTSSVPTFPSGNDNGERDACLSPSGANICQQVVVTGERPGLAGCIFTPFGSVCTTRPPPVPLDPYDGVQPAPSGRRPWLPQAVCNNIHILCSEGQIPEGEAAPIGDYDKLVEWTQACLNRAQGKLNMCKALSLFNSMEWLTECTNSAQADAHACMAEFEKGSQ